MGDSSSSSTIIRRFRSLMVEGVVAASALPGSGWPKGVIVSMGTASTLTGVMGSMELLFVFDTGTGAGDSTGRGTTIGGDTIVGVSWTTGGDVISSAGSGGGAIVSLNISVGSVWTTGWLGSVASVALAAARASLRFDTFSTFFLRNETNVISN